MKDKKLRLEQSLYKWLDTTDVIQEDILKLIDGGIITKSTIAEHIRNMKEKLNYLEGILKIM